MPKLVLKKIAALSNKNKTPGLASPAETENGHPIPFIDRLSVIVDMVEKDIADSIYEKLLAAEGRQAILPADKGTAQGIFYRSKSCAGNDR